MLTKTEQALWDVITNSSDMSDLRNAGATRTNVLLWLGFGLLGLVTAGTAVLDVYLALR